MQRIVLKLGARYLADTRAHRRQQKPFFIDKMPNNFRHIGLIHLMLPNAKLIDVRREPMACCFSNLKQLFARGQELTYSVEDIARYYRTYLELMRHWDAVLPGRILRAWYEDVVEDLEGILQPCIRTGLPGVLQNRTHCPLRARQPFSATDIVSGKVTSAGSARLKTGCGMR